MECRAPKELTEFILSEAEKDGYAVVHIATKGGGTFHVEVVLDKDGKITIDECGAFNRKITEWIEAQKMFTRGYVIDVCSPGLDREIRSEREFAWAAGKKVHVSTHEPVEGEREVIGVLTGAEGGELVLDAGGKTVTIKKENVKKARLHVTL